MNERILELAEQATRIEESDELFPREVFDREKFAELIVRECVDILNTRKDHSVIVNSIKEIKQHFGVEE